MPENANAQLTEPADCLLLVVDIQDKLLPKIYDCEQVAERSARMVQAARVLNVPVVVTEQYPQRLGDTVDTVAQHLEGLERHGKLHFSCCGSDDAMAQIRQSGAGTLVLVGIETHVCVLQTALEALALGYKVHVVRDAVGSRSPFDADAAFDRLSEAGVVLSTSEMLILEWVREAGAPAFKQVLPLIK